MDLLYASYKGETVKILNLRDRQPVLFSYDKKVSPGYGTTFAFIWYHWWYPIASNVENRCTSCGRVKKKVLPFWKLLLFLKTVTFSLRFYICEDSFEKLKSLSSPSKHKAAIQLY